MQTVSEGSEGAEDDDDDTSSGSQDDVITQGLKGTAAAFKTIPADGAHLLDVSPSSRNTGKQELGPCVLDGVSGGSL